MKKIKVVWLCPYSNSSICSEFSYAEAFIPFIWHKLLRKSISLKPTDDAQWISNGIEEVKNIPNIELHILAGLKNLRNPIQETVINGIYYHFYREQYSLKQRIIEKFTGHCYSDFLTNCKNIIAIIHRIEPDLINLYGAENPSYASAILQPSLRKYPILISLQTLMNHPVFIQNKSMDEHSFRERSKIEEKVLQSTNYISSGIEDYGNYILKKINPNAYIFSGSLALGEKSNPAPATDKKYDFVFFANDISKGVDMALRAFEIVKHKKNDTSLLVIGSCSNEERKKCNMFIENHDLKGAVTITGRLDTHIEVLNAVRTAKVAVIPLKVDLISGTIREAMSQGVPVVTTITEGTPSLNLKRESVLLSPIGDDEEMAANMMKLINDSKYADLIRTNAYITVQEKYSNEAIIKKTVQSYYAIIGHFKNGTSIPDNLAKRN